MAQLNKGTTYSTGDQVTAANLNALVDSATLQPGAITEQLSASSLTTSDSTLLSQAGGIRKATLGQLQTLFGAEGIFLKADGSIPMATGQQLTLGSTSQIAPLSAVSLGHIEANFLKKDGSVAMTTGQQLTLGSTSQIAPLNAVSLGYLQANYASAGFGFNAKVVFDGRMSTTSTVNFTYVKTNNKVVITTPTSHNFILSNTIWAHFNAPTSGPQVTDGDYSMVALSANQVEITVTAGADGAGSGYFRKCSILAADTSGTIKVNSVIARGLATQTTNAQGYWVNLSLFYYNASTVLGLISLSNFGTAAALGYAVVDKYGAKANSSLNLQPYTTAGVAAESGQWTGVTITGGQVNPLIVPF